MLYRLPPHLQDCVRATGLAVGAGLSLAIPEAADARIASGVAGLQSALRPGLTQARGRELAVALGVDAGEGRRVWEENQVVRMVAAIGRARGVRQAWRPNVSIEGLSRLHEALDQGRGAVLWRMSFCASPVAKIALANAGVDLVHLSAEFHGARSRGRAGKWVTTLYRRGEDPYLAERIVMRGDGSLGYVKELMGRLKAGAAVSVFGEYPSRQSVRVPVFDATVEIATGAPGLALRTGAELLPTFTRWEGGDRYTMVIGLPIALQREGPRKEAVALAVDEFGSRLEEAIRQAPPSWIRWPAFLNRRRVDGAVESLSLRP
jgi:lauroyl/myristoyl acyltransferase